MTRCSIKVNLNCIYEQETCRKREEQINTNKDLLTKIDCKNIIFLALILRFIYITRLCMCLYIIRLYKIR